MMAVANDEKVERGFRMNRLSSRLFWVAWAAMGVTTINSLVRIAASAEPHWNQFRGPHGSGGSELASLPLAFGEEQQIRWKTPIHGKGWSSPVIWDDQVWLTTAPEDGSQLYAVCVNLSDGQIEHDVSVFQVDEPEFCHPTNSYASCTPYVEAGRVYVHFGTYGTACLDTRTGDVLWERRDLHCDHFRGPASSPIVHGDNLFLNYDGVDIQFVVALDKRTGETVWKKDRDIDYGTDVGDSKKAYGTPSLIRVKDEWQLISPAAVETIAYAPNDGRPLWRVRHGGMNAAAPPLFEHGMVYIRAGEGDMSLIALRPEGTDDITSTSVVWQVGKGVPNRSSPLIVGDYLFMVSDDGVASCLNAINGDTVWSERLRDEHWSSPIHANGLLYFCSKNGTVTVVEAGPEFVLRSKNVFAAGFNASPAIAGNELILRSFTHLYCISS